MPERMGYFESDGIDLYRAAVERVSSGTFVEIGAWFGLSTSTMAKFIRDSGKPIKFYAVDIFKGTEGNGYLQGLMGVWTSEQQRQKYDKYTHDQGVQNYIETLSMTSVEASKLFEDQSVDFIFIDGSHEYQDVKNDIEAWFPKIKIGGIMAGHDYNAWEVQKAVNEFFSESKIETPGCCWQVQIKE